MFSDEYGVTLLGRNDANNLTYSSKTVQTYGASSYIISFDSSGNLNNMEVNDNLSSNLNVEYSQSTDGSIYTARYVSNSWNDSSGNQYPSGISFTKFVNGSIDWVRTVAITISMNLYVGYYYTTYQYSEMFSDEYGVTLLGRNDANNLTYGSNTVRTYGTSSYIVGILNSEDFDDDNDGILDSNISCPKENLNWVSNPSTDIDSDGCQDLTEDAPISYPTK